MRKSTIQPIVFLVLAFAAGILIRQQAGLSALYAFGPILPLVLLSGLSPKLRRKQWFGVAVLGATTALGVCSQDIALRAPQPDLGAWLGREAVVEAEVAAPPRRTEKGQAAQVQLLSLNGQAQSGGLMAYLPEGEQALLPGDRIRFSAQLAELSDRNAGYRAYLERQGIQGRAFAREYERVAEGQGLMHGLAALRHDLSQRMRAAMPDENVAALATAILLGDRNGLDPEMRERFSVAGVSHLLAISGLHVGLIWLLLSQVLGWLCFTPSLLRWRGLAVAALLCGYALLTGGAPAVVRAVSLIAMYEFAKAFYLQARPLTLLAVAAFGQLLWNPTLLFDPGFQLSYAAVTGILTCGRPLQVLLIRRWRWMRGATASMIAMTLCAQAFTAPFIFAHFGSLPVWFLPANLLIMPFAVWGVRIGFAALVFCTVPFVGEWLCRLTDLLLHLTDTLSGWVASLPAATVNRLSFSDPGFVMLLSWMSVAAFCWQFNRIKTWGLAQMKGA